MKRKFWSFNLLLSVILFSCSDHGRYINPSVDYTRTDDMFLEYSHDISFELDSITTNAFTASQFIPNENIYSFMDLNKNVLFYDYDTKQLLYKIALPSNQPSSYQYIDKDTIILWDYSTDKILIINDSAEILESQRIVHKIEHYPSPVTKISPITYIDGSIYIFGNIAGEYDNETDDNRRVLLNYNLQSKESKYLIPYPNIYKENWNGTLFRWCYAEYNPHKDVFIISFPADHFLYVYDYKCDCLSKVYAGSNRIDATEYIKKSKSTFIDADERTRHFVESNSYSNIMYDQYNDVYYRLAEIKDKYEGIPRWRKNISVIILDSNFNIIGETFIGPLETVYRYSSFITKQGLHLINNKNEDSLNFSVYKLINK